MSHDILVSKTQKQVVRKMKKHSLSRLGFSSFIGTMAGAIPLIILGLVSCTPLAWPGIDSMIYISWGVSSFVLIPIFYAKVFKYTAVEIKKNHIPLTVQESYGAEESRYGEFAITDEGIYQETQESCQQTDKYPNPLLQKSFLKQRINWDGEAAFEQEIYDTPLGLWENTMEAVEHENR